ncbi:MAG: type II secretion system protein GspE [Acidobacteria bacterium]|nr:type II secretion system protein GspE [Acidobacteriota bacterium]
MKAPRSSLSEQSVPAAAGDGDPTLALSARHGVPSIDLARFDIEPEVVRLIPADAARQYQVVPIHRAGSTLTVAMSNPRDVAALDDLAFLTGCRVAPVVASRPAVEVALARYYRPSVPPRETGREAAPDSATGIPAAPANGEQPPAVRLVQELIDSAIDRGASDIHVEPYDGEFRVRFRIDGVLQPVMAPDVSLRDAITSRLKVMAKLDIAEKRLPQDGRIRLRHRDADDGAPRTIDLRVSSLPTLFGETIVLRVLDQARLKRDMTQLGFDAASLRRFEASIRKPWGMVLATGPTGSGKTSTLYSAIARLNTPGVNIMTAEDPVEFNLNGVNQVLVRDGIGLSFAAALRAFLRQDPNVILVGEIRDVETAAIAVKAALTGHLVLSTLHTNDAPGAVYRLLDMGIEPFLVAASVHLICAQRLVRRICEGCAAPAPVSPSVLADLGFDRGRAASVVPRAGKGCDACGRTGYQGRVGLYEVMELNPAVRELILAGAPARALREAAVADGMVTLRESGLRKIAAGVTTIEEVRRETLV